MITLLTVTCIDKLLAYSILVTVYFLDSGQLGCLVFLGKVRSELSWKVENVMSRLVIILISVSLILRAECEYYTSRHLLTHAFVYVRGKTAYHL